MTFVSFYACVNGADTQFKAAKNAESMPRRRPVVDAEFQVKESKRPAMNVTSTMAQLDRWQAKLTRRWFFG
jgi:hypothetical protein